MTHRIPVDPEGDVPHEAVDAILRGAVVAYPTDTLYGLAVDPRQGAAVAQLRRVKARFQGGGLTLIAASLSQVEAALGPMPPLGRRLADTFWPGPLTVIFVPAVSLATGIQAPDGSVAVRVPANALARKLAFAAGFPITATSANLAGATPAETGTKVAELMGDAVALILEQPGVLRGAPSTIVDIRGAVPALVRAGVVAWDRVLQSAR
jgi:L-threonylcarbamoyladenylate synthase